MRTATVLGGLLAPVLAYALQVVTEGGQVLDDNALLRSGRPQIRLWQALHGQAKSSYSPLSFQTPTPDLASSDSLDRYPPHCFPQPIDHFASPNTTGSETFCQRFWLDASHYKPGGPVYVLDGGETSGEDRLPFLSTGILEILANATDGLAIVLEHRYYGQSLPVKNLTTDSLRFLTNAQALADSANFIANFTLPDSVHLPGNVSLRPPHTPWIYYGGSYAGARAAHMRVGWPDLVWGAIASSAVTHAQVNFPEYWEPIRQYGDPKCIAALESAIETIDHILDLPAPMPRAFKSLFGLGDLVYDDDFADVIGSVLGFWQAKNWDPTAPGALAFDGFCEALTSGGADSKIGLVRIPAAVLNYARWIKQSVVGWCPDSDVEQCFGTHDDESFRVYDKEQTWRLWLFQVCTQWGYFMPAPLDGPRIVSNRLTLEYTSKICTQAFPPGMHFSVPPLPNVAEVNDRGDYAIEADRLAFIDGDRDPWRPATPQADTAPKRVSTLNKPAHIIFDGVHHYDEFGLANHDEEPRRIRTIHAQEIEFVQSWLKEWTERL